MLLSGKAQNIWGDQIEVGGSLDFPPYSRGGGHQISRGVTRSRGGSLDFTPKMSFSMSKYPKCFGLQRAFPGPKYFKMVFLFARKYEGDNHVLTRNYEIPCFLN